MKIDVQKKKIRTPKFILKSLVKTSSFCITYFSQEKKWRIFPKLDIMPICAIRNFEVLLMVPAELYIYTDSAQLEKNVTL